MADKGFIVQLILVMALSLAAGAAFAQSGASVQSASPSVAPSLLFVQLLFDGHTLDSKENPQFSCYDETRRKWFNCNIQAEAGSQCYFMDRPAPGQYRVHVSIDENKNNPKSYPGDYEAIQRFEVTANSPDTLFIDVPQVIHLTSPGDNDRSLEGIFDACQGAPGFEAPFFSMQRTAKINFSWVPIIEGAQYQYSIYRTRCEPWQRIERLNFNRVEETSVNVELPANQEGEYYQFAIEAYKNGRVIGVLYIHDGGTHGWEYSFRMGMEKPQIDVAVLVLSGSVLIAFLLAFVLMLRTKQWSLSMIWLAAFFFGGWLGNQLYTLYQERREKFQKELQEYKAMNEGLQKSLNHNFVTEWKTAAPVPEWWDEVQAPAYSIDNVGNLLSAWQSGFGKGDQRVYSEQQFFKAAYQGIVNHPEDRDLTATAISLLAYVSYDYPYRAQMQEFGLKHFFDFHQRTDNCVNCKVGDTTNSMVANLSTIYISEGWYDRAIELIERLRREREGEVSDHALAHTLSLLGEAYWRAGARQQAIEVMTLAVKKYGSNPDTELLRKRLESYQREIENASR